MIERKATAVWHGKGKAGEGFISSDSGVLDSNRYSYHTRFEDEAGTNPEELIAAAHAGCFTMQFNFLLAEKGYEPKTIETTCTIFLDSGTLVRSSIEVSGSVSGISGDAFKDVAQEALDICPISRALNMDKGVKVSLGNQ